MDFDISHLLEQWDYKPGQVAARRFKGKDGKEKLQMRIDLGILQMNAAGRPDGKRPFGHNSLFEFHQSRLYRHVGEHDGSDEGFSLSAEDCSRLQLESLQYQHRCLCLLQLGDYPAVIRDAERNLAVIDFVARHAESEELAWPLRQFQPQLLVILTRAKAMQFIECSDYAAGIQQVELGIESIRAFQREHGRAESVAASELQSLERWLEELRAKRPLTTRERLERALQEAVRQEDYETAARVRDALRDLEAENQ
ncbi:MAG TPA: hypothetical protein GYA07_01720 [Verrucomicrobia bacterium]|nr:hypothetical protein [Verrucomicrobiota bacterium]HOP97499.1 UvrB/UvrC motif-containing protein [Verrucomicrobiota bacterium]